jgi:hypothetical protein
MEAKELEKEASKEGSKGTGTESEQTRMEAKELEKKRANWKKKRANQNGSGRQRGPHST